MGNHAGLTNRVKYPGGLVANVQQGQGPSQSQSVARSVAKDVVSPPIAVRRIDR